MECERCGRVRPRNQALMVLCPHCALSIGIGGAAETLAILVLEGSAVSSRHRELAAEYLVDLMTEVDRGRIRRGEPSHDWMTRDPAENGDRLGLSARARKAGLPTGSARRVAASTRRGIGMLHDDARRPPPFSDAALELLLALASLLDPPALDRMVFHAEGHSELITETVERNLRVLLHEIAPAASPPMDEGRRSFVREVIRAAGPRLLTSSWRSYLAEFGVSMSEVAEVLQPSRPPESEPARRTRERDPFQDGRFRRV